MNEQKDSYLVLMADGSIEDHNMVKRAFRDCEINHVFNSVYNGKQLLDHFLLKGAYSREDDVQPDLVIMDIKLDLVDGFEVLKFLNENREIYTMPVYVLTAHRTEEVARLAEQLGVKHVYQKPETYIEYARIVQEMCSRNLPPNRQV
ncbi:MAG TPA: response regulator [Chitinophagaceae bacterium]|nr:response regulator [Chitinophagaceae bacterium]